MSMKAYRKKNIRELKRSQKEAKVRIEHAAPQLLDAAIEARNLIRYIIGDHPVISQLDNAIAKAKSF